MSMIVKDILTMGINMLERAGIENPRVDAEALFCYILHMTKTELFMSWPKELTDDQVDRFLEIVDLRLTGKPLQYIVGSTAFMGLDFEVNENVLIPRQDTEILVERALAEIRASKEKHPRILDLCTGSGAIAVSVAYLLAHPEALESNNAKPISANVFASDISEKAITVAKNNAIKNKVKIDFSVGDLFDPYKGRLGNKKFDFILTNPPYIKTEVIPTLQVEVKDHEPHIALDGGSDGLDYYRIILAAAPDFLRDGGILMMEIGHDQAEDICELASGFSSCEILNDLAGHTRVALIHK